MSPDRTTHNPVLFVQILALVVAAAVTPAVVGSESASIVNPASITAPDTIRALITAERYGEAERRARLRVDAIESAPRPDSLRLGEALDLLVEALWRGGRAASAGAAEVSERAVYVRERTVGPDHPDMASSLHHRANLLKAAGVVERVRPLFERILDIRLRALGPGHRDVARTLNDYGNLLQMVGSYTEAESLYHRSRAAYEQIGESQRRNLGKVLNNLAVLYLLDGGYVRARQSQERSKAIFEHELGPEHPNVAVACVNLGSLLMRTGDLDQARELLERGLAIHERALGPDHADVAWNLRVLAAVNAKAGDSSHARRQLERAVAIHERSLGPGHIEVALDLIELARIAETTGNDSAAVSFHERALAVNEHALGRSHPRTALGLADLARLRALGGDLDAARQMQERALAIREEALGRAHPDVAASHFALGQTQWALNRGADAFRSALQSEEISREHLRLTLRTLPERQALTVADERIHGLDLALSISLADSAAASSAQIVDAIVRSRAVVLEEMVERGRAAMAAADPEIAARERELNSARQRLAHLIVRGQGDGPLERYRSLLDRARHESEAAQRALAESSLRFREGQRKRRAGLAEVRAVMPSGAALVSFFAYDHWSAAPHGRVGDGSERSPIPSYIACLIRSDQDAPVLIPLGAAATVDTLVARWAREMARCAKLPAWELGQAETAYRRAGRALADRVWAPIASHLRGVERVFVVPDGALNLVHFDTLPTSAGYLIQGAPVFHYLSAERHLIAETEERVTGKGLLAIGGPDFGTPRERIRSAATRNKLSGPAPQTCAQPPHFEPLPLAVMEAKWIAERWNQRWSLLARARGALDTEEPEDRLATCLVGSAATEDAFKRLAPGKEVLHLATHGYFGRPSCTVDEPSDLAATKGPRTTRPLQEREELVVTGGLAFAGANRRATVGDGEQDGILTPEEIAGLDLDTVEWTVLSACNTGVGDVRAGEGVFGLRRSFEIARCRSLIMSLWPVPDDVARDWMQVLYTGKFTRRLDTASAVRAASLELLKRQRATRASTHPFFWAGFIAAGDWR